MKKITDALKGIIIALIAAYFFMVMVSFGFGDEFKFMSNFVVIPLFGLLYSFGLIIPLGVALGVTISLVLSLVGFLPALRMGHWQDFGFLLLMMSLYSAVWTGAYAYLHRRKFV